MRIPYIDNLRGFAIILVVLGHSIQYLAYPSSFDQNYLFRLIYSFHMPLFFFISGMTTPFHEIGKNDFMKKVWKRTKQLLIPFFLWKFFIWILFRDSSYFNIFVSPSSGLWFLWVLFWIYLFFQIVMLLSYISNIKKEYLLVIMYIIIQILSHYIGSFGIQLISKYIIYFILGSLIGVTKEKLPYFKYSGYVIPVSMICFFVFSFFWYRDVDKIPVDSPSWLFELNNFFLYNFVTAFFAICLFLFFTSKYFNSQILGGVFSYLGKRTLGIYAIHQTICWLIEKTSDINFYSNEILIFFMWSGINVSFLLLMIVSLLLYKLLSLNKYTDFCLLGNV